MAAIARDSLVFAFMRIRSSQNSLCGALATRTACTADVRSSAPPSFEPVSYSHRSAAGQTFTAAPRGHSGEIQQDCRKKTLTFHRRGAERFVRPRGSLCRLSTAWTKLAYSPARGGRDVNSLELGCVRARRASSSCGAAEAAAERFTDPRTGTRIAA